MQFLEWACGDSMQDVKDLNPELSDSDLEEWAQNTDNPHLAEYLRSCKDE